MVSAPRWTSASGHAVEDGTARRGVEAASVTREPGTTWETTLPMACGRLRHYPFRDERVAAGKRSDAMAEMDDVTRTELEAAAFRRLVEHLRTRTDVQNIDLMNLAGFCRNCLSNWYQEAAAERGIPISKNEAREHIYGMPYDEWKAKHHSDAPPEAKAKFEDTHRH